MRRRGFLAAFGAAVASARALLAGDTGPRPFQRLTATLGSQSSTFLVCGRCAGYWPPIPCDHGGLASMPEGDYIPIEWGGGVASIPEFEADWISDGA